ncbi:hypothetical protein [Thorsellia kenyensis]|uniref:Uncharacterized protein n=1 Tax=Thorsellia kenyensis TaxID=1549888 RepID=A0ABV6CBY5_9GAMM
MYKPEKRLVYIFSLGPLLIGLALYFLYGLVVFLKLTFLQETQSLGQFFFLVIMRLLPPAIFSFVLVILPTTVFGIVFVHNLHREHMQQNILCGLFVPIIFLIPLATYLIYALVVERYHNGPAEVAEFLLVCFATIFIPLLYGLIAFVASFLLNTLYFQRYRKKALKIENINSI